jgi:hypothetical protein
MMKQQPTKHLQSIRAELMESSITLILGSLILIQFYMLPTAIKMKSILLMLSLDYKVITSISPPDPPKLMLNSDLY